MKLWTGAVGRVGSGEAGGREEPPGPERLGFTRGRREGSGGAYMGLALMGYLHFSTIFGYRGRPMEKQE